MSNTLSAVKQLLTNLTSEEQEEIRRLLEDGENIREILGMSEAPPCKCRCCGSASFIKNGHETKSGRQRYLCKDCKRTFTSLTGTVLDRMHKKEEFIRYVNSFIRNLTLREAAGEHGITLNTSFNWRHKLLHALGLSAGDVELAGEIQADEKYIPFQPRGSQM